MEFYIRAIFNISFRKYFHIDNKDVKFPFDDHCFSLMIQYKFEFSLPWREAGGTDTLRTEDSSLSREFVTPWHSLLTQFPVKSEAPSSRAPPIATVCHLPALTPANSGNVKQGLTKAALNFLKWSLSGVPIVISRNGKTQKRN